MYKQFIILIAFIFFQKNLFSDVKETYTCLYSNQDKVVVLENSIADMSYQQKGKINGDKYSLFVAKVGNFDELDDYISFTDEKDHMITYSLRCN